MNDVADVLEQAAHGAMHTPYLYSCLLRALVSAKTDAEAGGHAGASSSGSSGNGNAHDAGVLAGAFSSGGNPLAEFQFDSEMGPGAADISTFPPTMGPGPTEEGAVDPGLNMDSILNGFWESVLVPGA